MRNELNYSTGRRILQEEIHTPRTGPEVDVAILKESATKHFSGEHLAEEIFQNEAFFNELADRAKAEGLSPAEMNQVMDAVRRQVSIQANFEAREELTHFKAGAKGFLDKVRRGMVASVHEAGEHLGFGIARTVMEKQARLVAAQDDMQALMRSALEVQVMKHRLTEYTHLGGHTFAHAIEQYQGGKLKYNELLQDKEYLAGLEKIVQAIKLDDDFIRDNFDSDPAHPIDTSDPNVQTAIRRHLIFVLRTEVVQLAEMQQLEVLSSEEYSAEAKTRGQKVKKIARTVLTSGTVWGAVTRVGTKVAIGGALAFTSPAWLGATTAILVGVGTSAAAGYLAGTVREKFFSKKERHKRHRLEAALGAVDTDVVKSAEHLQKELHDKALAVQQLTEAVKQGSARPEQLKQAVLVLYHAVADVQVRLLRSRIGENPIAELTPVAGSAPVRPKRPLGHGVGHAAVGHAAHGPDHDATQSDSAEKRGPRQDYISFGIANRFKAQQQLLSVFAGALLTVEAAVEQQGGQAGALRQDMQAAYHAAEQQLDVAEKKLRDKVVKQDEEYLTRAKFIGATAGGIAALAMDFFGHLVSAESLPTTLPEGQTTATITQPELGVQATLHDNGVIDISKHGVSLAQAHLPEGVSANQVHLEFSGDDIVVLDAHNGEELNMLNLSASTVLEGDQALRSLTLTPNFSPQAPFPFTHAGQNFTLMSDPHGTLQLHRVVGGGAEQSTVGAPFSIVNDAVKGDSETLAKSLQFEATYHDGQLVVRSALDGQPAATIQLENTIAAATPVTPARATGFLEKVMANPTLQKILNDMGVQTGEVKFDAVTNNFDISKAVLHTADGKLEYLGQTDGWRATRMEFILKAASEHRLNESPEMIVARAERATRHVLMEGAKYKDPQAAFHEAFIQRDASFIQSHDLKWVNDVKADVRNDWMRVVAEMQKPDVVGGGAPAAGEVVVQPGVTVQPLTAERLLAPTSSAKVLTEWTSPYTPAALAEGIAARADDFMEDHDHNLELFLGVSAGTMVELLGAGYRSPEIALRYIKRNPEQLLNVQDGYTEYKKGQFGDDDIPDPSRGTVQEASGRIKQEQLDGTRTERSTEIVRQLNEFVRTADADTKGTYTELETLRTDMSTAVQPEHIQKLITLTSGITALQQRLDVGKRVLGRTDQDLTYATVDAAHGNVLTNWIASREQVLHIEAGLQSALEQVVAEVTGGLADAADLFKSKQRTAPQTRDRLVELTGKLQLLDQAQGLRGTVITDTAKFDALHGKADQLKLNIDGGTAVTNINERIGADGNVHTQVMDRLLTEGCLTDRNDLLPTSAKMNIILNLVRSMSTFALGQEGLRQMGFLNADPVHRNPFGSKQERRITQVLDRLFAGAANIFDTAPSPASTPVTPSPIPPTPTPLPIEPVVGATAAATEGDKNSIVADPNLDAPTDEELP